MQKDIDQQAIAITAARKALIAKLAIAFEDVGLADGIGLREAMAIDDYATAVERAACRAEDEQEDWRRISLQDLALCAESLSYFDAKGMRFHLPAFMLFNLQADDLPRHLKFQTNLDLRWTLAEPDTEYRLGQFSLLNEEQLGCIVDFWALELAEDRAEESAQDFAEESAAALKYWTGFAQTTGVRERS